MTLIDFRIKVTGLIFICGLMMTQMPKQWQAVPGWLLVSRAGIASSARLSSSW